MDDATDADLIRSSLYEPVTIGEDGRMDLGHGISVDTGVLGDLLRRHRITRLSVYGSTLRSNFRPDSDIDLLVEFEPGRTPGMLTIAGIELELEDLLGHSVELRTYGDLSRYFRDEVCASARQLSAA